MKKKSIESIINNYSLSYKYINNIVNTYKRNIKKIKINNRRNPNKKQKFKEDHISHIKEYWQDDIGIHYIIFSIKTVY